MSDTVVYKIFNDIKHLADEDRVLLDTLLAEFGEQEWRQEVVAARQIAERQGLDQEAIDAVIERVRYPA